MKSVITVALLLMSTQAIAADFYLTAAGQYQNAETDTAAISESVRADGYGGAIGFGWDFASDADIEIVLDYASGDNENDVEVSQASISFNAFYAPTVGNVQPRIGAGIGVAAIDAEFTQNDPEAGFMAQASAGMLFWTGDHFAIGPMVRWRYTDASLDGVAAETVTLIAELGFKVRF